MKKRILSGLLVFAMILSLFNGLGMNLTTAKADEPVGEHSSHSGFTAWTATEGEMTTGSYYLSGELIAKGYIDIPARNEVTLCLNGYTLDIQAYASIRVSGTLHICDCTSSGTIMINVNNSGSAITNNGKLIISSGKIHTQYNCGVANDGNMTVSGTAEISGTSGILSGSNSSLVISGDGVTVKGTSGSAIVLRNGNNNVELIGAPTLQGVDDSRSIHLESGVIHVSQYTGDPLSLSFGSGFNGTVVEDSTDSSKFVLPDKHELVSIGNNLVLNKEHSHKNESDPYTILTSLSGELMAGNYYLPVDLTATENVTIPAGAEVTLCLNNFTLNMDKYVIEVKGGGTLNICSCRGYDSQIKGSAQDDGIIHNLGTFIADGQVSIKNNAGYGIYNDAEETSRGEAVLMLNNNRVVQGEKTGIYNAAGASLELQKNTQVYGIHNCGTVYLAGAVKVSRFDSSTAGIYCDNISKTNNAPIYAHSKDGTINWTGTSSITIARSEYINKQTVVEDIKENQKNKITLYNAGDCTLSAVADGDAYDLIIEKPHTHVWSEEWSSDEHGHWHVCKEEGCDITDYSQVPDSSYESHTPKADDGSCLTAVRCEACDREVTADKANHNYMYTAQDNVITESCGNEGCTAHSKKATISAPAGDLVYDGNTKFEASVVYETDWVGTKPAIIYICDSSSTEDLTQPGKYVASITVGGKTASVSYTVTSPGSVAITSDISKIYDGSAVEEPAYTKAGTGAVTIEYKVKSAADSTYGKTAPINAGAYTVRVTVAADDIYGTVSATRDFTIATRPLAEADFEIDTTGFVYNGNAFEPVVNSQNVLVTGADYTVAYNNNIKAGENTAELRITGKNNASGVVTIKFTIAKATVTEPAISSKTYTGKTLIADVVNNERYTVETNVGGINAADNYEVKLKLTDGENYKWSTTDDATVTLKFAITKATNAWTTEPSITGWTYKGQASVPVGEASFGNVEFTYYDSTKALLDAKPTKAGIYYMKATVADGGANYNGLESDYIAFTIEKAEVTVPEAPASKVYTGTALTADIAGTDLYTVEKNDGGTNVAQYDVVLKLKDSTNYKWSTTTDATVTLKFAITKGTNTWTLTPDIADWCYDEDAKNPVGTAKFGEVVFTYYDSQQGALSEKPTTAGSYYMKASVAADGINYDAISTDYIAFAITAAANSWTITPSIAGWTYGKTASIPVGAAKYGTPQFTYYTYDGSQYQELNAQPINAGTYYMKAAVPADGTQYSGIESDYIRFTIEKAVPETSFPTDLNVGTMNEGEKTTLADVALAAGYTWDAPTTEVVYGPHSYAMTFTPEDTNNYKVVKQNVTVVGKDVTSPAGKLIIADNEWTNLWNGITFGLFFKETQTVTVTAADTESGVVKTEYYLSAREVGEVTQWTEFEDSFKIDPNNQYVVYVKITDGAGNAVIINSDGVVLDNIAPVLTGIVNGGTYYQQVEVTVTDAYFDKVEVNGQPVTVTNDQFTLTASSERQTVKAYDKAGNISAEMIVLVEENHTAYQWGDITDNGDGTYARIGTCACGHELKVTAPAETDSPVSGLEEEAEAKGKDLKLEIETDVEKIDAAEREAIRKKMREDETALFLDITLKEIIGDEEVSITNNVLEIPVAFDFAGKLNVVVYRNHLNVVQRFYPLLIRPTENFRDGSYFLDVENQIIYVYSNLFSTYGVAYHAHAAKEVPAKAATSSADGNIRYWFCEGCGKYFADAASVREITQAETVVKYVAPKPESKPQNKPEENKTPASQAPMTGDTANTALWLSLMMMSAVGAVGTVMVEKKRRRSK